MTNRDNNYQLMMALAKYLRDQQDPYVEQDPAYLDAAAGYQNLHDKMGLQHELMKLGMADARHGMPQGQSVRNGIYVAPSPLEVAANATRNAMGIINQNKAIGQMDELMGERKKSNRMGLDARERMLAASAAMRQQQPPAGSLGLAPPWNPLAGKQGPDF